jgi:hypothetical protein
LQLDAFIMSFRSILVLVAVTASFALGGCAADAEQSPATESDVTAHDGNLDADRRLDHVRQIGTISDLQPARLDDAARARIIETYNGGVADPRIDVQPPVFGQAQQISRRGISLEDMKDVVDAHTVGSKP